MNAKSASETWKATSLQASPYRVDESSRRERYWFADGVWLDQGQTASVVGIVLTHWLADRGLRVKGGDLDDEFARELFHASQRAAGQAEDNMTGTSLEAAMEVLSKRGLIETAYVLKDIDEIVLALLERGPVLAGVMWRASMSSPEWVDGRALCRVDPDDQPQGAHAVLLNAVVRDGTAGDGGLVRFKNSWGRGWGDRGHAWISIDDLARALRDKGVSLCLLPIPAPSALQDGVRQDVSIPEEREVVRYEQESIGSDLWTTQDTVGYGPYAEAIARAIQHAETRPPLTIGIKAPWGAGKTSLMRMIRDRLEWPTADHRSATSESLRAVTLTAGSTTKLAGSRDRLPDMTNGTVLRMAKESRGETAKRPPRLSADPKPIDTQDESKAVEDRRRWRPTVWFNPWMYQTGKQVWAGLAHEIITQVTDRMSPREREYFWLRLNLKRIDEQSVRRTIYALVVNRVIPYAIAGFSLLAGGLVVLAGGWSQDLGAALTGAGPGLTILATGAQLVKVLTSPVSGSLSQAVSSSADVRRFAGHELGGSFDQLIETPDYRSQTGFLYLVRTDIQRVLDLVATPDCPLVVFVDDLDRCSPSTVVQVIEAINLFLAGEYPNSIFVLAIEPDIVAAHVEAAYENLVEKLKEAGAMQEQSVDLGWKFLEKIVQLPLTLPAIEKTKATAFYESLFADGTATGAAQSRPSAPPREADVAAAEQQLAEISLKSAYAVASGSDGGDADGREVDEAVKEAARRIVERKLARDDPGVVEAITYATRFLHPNPREIKRFVNVFRFFTMVSTRLAEPQSLDGLAKISVLSIRWPSLLSTLALPMGGADSGTVFELLEAPSAFLPGAGELPALEKRLDESRLGPATIKRLLADDLLTFIQSEPRLGTKVSNYL